MLDHAEQTNNKTLLVLLDWEKAFDKVTRHGLFTAIDRIGIPAKLQQLIRMIYAAPEFCTELEGSKSAWYAQEAGIRQG